MYWFISRALPHTTASCHCSWMPTRTWWWFQPLLLKTLHILVAVHKSSWNWDTRFSLPDNLNITKRFCTCCWETKVINNLPYFWILRAIVMILKAKCAFLYNKCMMVERLTKYFWLNLRPASWEIINVCYYEPGQKFMAGDVTTPSR